MGVGAKFFGVGQFCEAQSSAFEPFLADEAEDRLAVQVRLVPGGLRLRGGQEVRGRSRGCGRARSPDHDLAKAADLGHRLRQVGRRVTQRLDRAQQVSSDLCELVEALLGDVEIDRETGTHERTQIVGTELRHSGLDEDGVELLERVFALCVPYHRRVDAAREVAQGRTDLEDGVEAKSLEEVLDPRLHALEQLAPFVSSLKIADAALDRLVPPDCKRGVDGVAGVVAGAGGVVRPKAVARRVLRQFGGDVDLVQDVAPFRGDISFFDETYAPVNKSCFQVCTFHV